mmetsp:Transcript_12154/g.19452  ORF Transcript_12154/g.19452 Transcript_12154/m.19452 type:complete len:87 (+) Transcript_12154:166-426(+)
MALGSDTWRGAASVDLAEINTWIAGIVSALILLLSLVSVYYTNTEYEMRKKSMTKAEKPKHLNSGSITNTPEIRELLTSQTLKKEM